MGLKVLVVDDNPAARYLIQQMLEADGHEMVAEAENFAQTIHAFKTHKPDIVTLDLSLANEDGLTILRALRKISAKVRVLIITANTQERVRQKLFKEGAAGYLTKPFNVEEFIGALRLVARNALREP